MPQSPVVKDYIEKKLSYRMAKDFKNMSDSLNMNNNKNSLLKENNDVDYDIFIDDDLLKDEKGEE